MSPLKIGPLTMRNRIEGAPMGFSDMLRTGEFCKENIAMYQALAKGGAAIVTVGETTVHTKTGRAHDRTTPLDDRDILPSLLEVSDAIRQHGAIPSIELIHPGHWANPRYTTGPVIYSASAGTHHRYGQVYEAVEMDDEVIEEVVESFGQAAYMAKIGGFEMCMIHGAHGWLISQFLSPRENRRTDRFGGSLENRARLPLMIIDRIRGRCGPDFPIEFRMSGKESADGEDELRESAEFAGMIDGKVDLIHVSVSSFAKKDTVPRMFPTMFLPHGCNSDISAYIKGHVRTPVVTVGRIGYPELMEEIIASGKADVVAMARGLMADPELPRKIREGREDEIVNCLRCNTCLSETFVSLLPYASRAMKCAVNPTCGREFQSRLWEKPRRSCKVLVAGGGPGGMQAAITAAERGHDVILCEKSQRLGGGLLTSSHIPFKSDIERYRESLVARLGRSAIKVKLGTPADSTLISVLKPDVLIAAIGASSAVCGIKGSGSRHVIKIEEVYLREGEIGRNVVIIGGGMSGVEEGLSLAMKGRSVTVVEMLEDIARDANFRGKEALTQELEKFPNLSCMTRSKASEITRDAVFVERADGTIAELAADTVIIAIGRVPLNDDAESLRELVPDFAIVGDCRRVGKIKDAVREGYSAAMNIY
jgi:2,4-dienoyl-CoA reductase-like NADH-dependent reductase (Old Yellow Enzyme family)/NADPH-dependent 2,4-dienoyl-CoA reductase/sulfur reductase-like enzyme